MIIKMVHSRKVKDAKSTYKENITSVITPYQLVGDIQGIREYFLDLNKACKKYSLAGLHDRMCFLMNKCGILRSESFFWCKLSDFWGFLKTDEEPQPLYCVVMKIFQGRMNPNRTLYVRFFHSVNEILCPVGAIFVYFSRVSHTYL